MSNPGLPPESLPGTTDAAAVAEAAAAAGWAVVDTVAVASAKPPSARLGPGRGLG